MKTITLDELFSISKNLESLTNFEVQGIYGTEDFFAIKLWNKKISWISVSLKGSTPFVYGPEEIFKFNKRLTKPVFTFFNKYFKQSVLESVSVRTEFGRVLEIEFKSVEDERIKIEIRLFRGGVNFGVFAKSKAVYLNRPDQLEVLSHEPLVNREPRNIDQIREEIFELVKAGDKSPSGNNNNNNNKAVAKIKIAQEKINTAIAFQNTNPYLRLAQKLESGESRDDIDIELKKLLTSKKSDQENILYCYEQHKLKDQRIDRLRRRLGELDQGGLSDSKE